MKRLFFTLTMCALCAAALFAADRALCKYCGSSNFGSGAARGSMQMLSSACSKSPRRYHDAYEGAESASYTCKHCGFQSRRAFIRASYCVLPGPRSTGTTVPPLPNFPLGVYLDLDIDHLAAFGADFYVQDTWLAVFGFGFNVGVEQSQLEFLIGEVNKGLEKTGQEALVALVSEEELENPVINRGQNVVHGFIVAQNKRRLNELNERASTETQ